MSADVIAEVSEVAPGTVIACGGELGFRRAVANVCCGIGAGLAGSILPVNVACATGGVVIVPVSCADGPGAMIADLSIGVGKYSEVSGAKPAKRGESAIGARLTVSGLPNQPV